MGDLETFFGVEAIKPNGLLLNCSRVPKPLHGQAPRVILGKSWWDIERQKAYARHNYHCMACGIAKDSEFILWKNQLHAHEIYEIDYQKCCMKLVDIVALCEACHYFIHDGRSHSLFDQGEYDLETIFLIVNRGLQVLGQPKDRAVLDCDEYYIETWGKWYLELEGKKYYSRFPDIKSWAKYYNVREE